MDKNYQQHIYCVIPHTIIDLFFFNSTAVCGLFLSLHPPQCITPYIYTWYKNLSTNIVQISLNMCLVDMLSSWMVLTVTSNQYILHSDQYFIRAQWDALLMQLYAIFNPSRIIVWPKFTLIFEKYTAWNCLLYDTNAFSLCQKTTHEACRKTLSVNKISHYI